MGRLFGIGGSAAKTDRKHQLASWGELQNLFGSTNKKGQSALDTGLGDIGKAKDYWAALMSGDPTKMSQALAPQISAIKGQSGQAIRGLEQFGGRSGGTSAAVNAQNVEAQSAIQNLFDMLGPAAAQEFGQLAGFGVGTGENLINTAAAAAGDVGAQAGGARQVDLPIQMAQQSAAMEGLGSLFDLFGNPSSGGSSSSSG